MRRLVVSAIAAGFLLSPAVGWTAPADRDAWVKKAEQRLDRVLTNSATLSPPGTRVGEVRVKVDSQGKLSGFEMVKSTGVPGDDAVLMNAAKAMDPLPAPPPSVVGRPLMVRVSFITPTQIEERYGKAELKPYIYLEETPEGTLIQPPQQ